MEPEALPDVKKVSIKNAEHYTWGNHCDGWFLLKSEDLHVIQEKMPAHSVEVMHYHGKSRQFFYVLRGELTVLTGKKSLLIGTECAVVIEPGTPHQARNESEEDAEFLVISCPPSHGDRFDCQ